MARVHRAAFDDRLPWLAGLHTPAEDEVYFRDHVLAACEGWGAIGDGALVGFVAFREVLPDWQGRGIGGRLLGIAKACWPDLRLWTFQRNLPARRFYAANGFVAIRETDGAGNEEREPEVLYRWCRGDPP